MAAECAKQSSPAVKIACAYISAACNRTPQSAKWSPERDELVYGSGRSLAVTNFADPSAPVVRCTLTLHKDRVNCVHFIQFRDSQGGSDGELGLCGTHYTDRHTHHTHTHTHTQTDTHTVLLNIYMYTYRNTQCLMHLFCCYHPPLQGELISGSVDKTVILWKKTGGNVSVMYVRLLRAPPVCRTVGIYVPHILCAAVHTCPNVERP